MFWRFFSLSSGFLPPIATNIPNSNLTQRHWTKSPPSGNAAPIKFICSLIYSDFVLIAVRLTYNTGLDMHIRVQIMCSGVNKVLLFVDHFLSQAYISHKWHFISFHLVSFIQMLLFSFQSNKIVQVRWNRLYRYWVEYISSVWMPDSKFKTFLTWGCSLAMRHISSGSSSMGSYRSLAYR